MYVTMQSLADQDGKMRQLVTIMIVLLVFFFIIGAWAQSSNVFEFALRQTTDVVFALVRAIGGVGEGIRAVFEGLLPFR